MDYLGPFTFNGVRSIIGGIALLPSAHKKIIASPFPTENPSVMHRKYSPVMESATAAHTERPIRFFRKTPKTGTIIM